MKLIKEKDESRDDMKLMSGIRKRERERERERKTRERNRDK